MVGDRFNDWRPSDCGRIITTEIPIFTEQTYFDVDASYSEFRKIQILNADLRKSGSSQIYIQTMGDAGNIGSGRMYGSVHYDSLGDLRTMGVLGEDKVFIEAEDSFVLEVEVIPCSAGLLIRLRVTNPRGPFVEVNLKSDCGNGKMIRIGIDDGIMDMLNTGFKAVYF